MTIKELAERYQISKQALTKRIKRLSESCYNVDDNGVYHITPEGVKILDEQLKNSRHRKKENADNVDDAIKALTEQIKVMSATIEKQNNQISDLTELLANEQKLHLMTQQKLLAIEDKAKKKWWHFFSKSSD